MYYGQFVILKTKNQKSYKCCEHI